MNDRAAKIEAFGRLLDIMDTLRAECPWDKKQTLESLRHLTIEETYELADAIEEGDLNEIKKELGDLMLHMVFYSKIGSEKGAFDVGDVLNSVCDKLIHRHPHIYGDVEATTEEEVKANWEAIKLKEKGTKSVLQGVPRGLPALVKAIRIGDKARGAGFDWEQPQDVWVKIREELVEFEDAQKSGNQDLIEGELGDVLFSIVNFARLSNLDPEMALERTNKKFIYRFTYMENAARNMGKSLADMSLEEMEGLWNEAKHKSRL
ncbi:MAG: nucleoside triphosphate pyrophosphohydrolase [Cryomorphaceae bacterium]|jgi:XTP/dITP diphosphohydrolase|nr:nucleoside triphosphate pyrophosphohydrolase [Cryomorphaceae bacterium]MDA8529630.1 nucleoside triphosphate pyrophosphohydrolase [Schleiferiaceae bacterium]PTM00777.1 MAG: nucleoside triphosphate pyrophosphohydrolase [Bacteroidota bacterium]MBL6681816.1 nucleoside triphosphate pyrophosphohydrolase [Cryomorphaceae bacterium]MDA8582174.1 nucleoside triphosphate pyrophosphohydrolase [Schleiferiaceae bacterium]